MITNVHAAGFKGMEFDQPLGQHTLITGKVGSGKSSRALALALTVTGTLPNVGVGQRNCDIYEAVGSGNALTVGITLDNGTTLERRYTRSKTGSVSCAYYINGVKTPKNLFELEVSTRGLVVAEIASFLASSDAKKVDRIFALYPPAGDVRGLTAKIASAKEALSTLNQSIAAHEKSLETLTATDLEMVEFAGSLPEIQAEIVAAEKEYMEAREALVIEKEKMRQEEIKRRELADRERAAKVAEQALTAEPDADCKPHKVGTPPGNGTQANSGHHGNPQPVRPPAGCGVAPTLQKILATMEKAGCTACAASLLIKRELRSATAAGA